MAVFGLGLAALGRPGYMTLAHAADFPSTTVEAMRAQAFEVLDSAFAAGLRHLDTARSYGRAEEFLREWLDSRKPTGVRVSSKWGYRYTADWKSNAAVHEVKEHSLSHLESQWVESRATLGAHLSVFQIHSATLESGVLSDHAVLDRLAQLRDEGVAMGLSVTGPRQPEIIDAAIAIQRGGRRLFDWVQATWNVLEPSAGPALQRAKAAGLHTIAKEGLANGRLSPRGDVPAWLELAKARGVTADALALGVALAQPFLDVVLCGAATRAQLESNVKATAVSDRDWERVSVSPTAFWEARSKLSWS